jgi:hypothetical protein
MRISPIGPIRPRLIAPSPQRLRLYQKKNLPSGDQSEVEPPGPIPNPEVKRFSANGSETIGLVRVGRRQVYAPFMET